MFTRDSSMNDSSKSKFPPMPVTDFLASKPAWLSCPQQVSKTYPAPEGVEVLPISIGGRNNDVMSDSWGKSSGGNKLSAIKLKLDTDYPIMRPKSTGIGDQITGGFFSNLTAMLGFGKKVEKTPLDRICEKLNVEDEQIRHHRDVFEPELLVRADGYMCPVIPKVDCAGYDSCEPIEEIIQPSTDCDCSCSCSEPIPEPEPEPEETCGYEEPEPEVDCEYEEVLQDLENNYEDEVLQEQLGCEDEEEVQEEACEETVEEDASSEEQCGCEDPVQEEICEETVPEVASSDEQCSCQEVVQEEDCPETVPEVASSDEQCGCEDAVQEEVCPEIVPEVASSDEQCGCGDIVEENICEEKPVETVPEVNCFKDDGGSSTLDSTGGDDNEYDDDECIEDAEGECIRQEDDEESEPEDSFEVPDFTATGKCNFEPMSEVPACCDDCQKKGQSCCTPMSNFVIRIQAPFADGAYESCEAVLEKLCQSRKRTYPEPKDETKQNCGLKVLEISLEPPTCIETPKENCPCKEEEPNDTADIAPIPTEAEGCAETILEGTPAIVSETKPCTPQPVEQPKPTKKPWNYDANPLTWDGPSKKQPCTKPEPEPQLPVPPTPEVTSAEEDSCTCPCSDPSEPPVVITVEEVTSSKDTDCVPDQIPPAVEECTPELTKEPQCPEAPNQPTKEPEVSAADLSRKRIESLLCGCPNCVEARGPNAEVPAWTPPPKPSCPYCNATTRGETQDCVMCAYTRKSRDSNRNDTVCSSAFNFRFPSLPTFSQDDNKCNSDVFDMKSNGQPVYEGGMCITRTRYFLWKTNPYENSLKNMKLENEDFNGFGSGSSDEKDCDCENEAYRGGMSLAECKNFMKNSKINN